MASVVFLERGVKVMGVPDKVSKLVRNSGNNFHAKVARWFSDESWHVIVSPYYMDQTQNKARELDLIAEKLWPINDMLGRQIDCVAVRLFIECKFVPSHSVFWLADKDQVSANELVCNSDPFRADNAYTNKHHYLAQSPKVAKLFATEGKTPENDPFYKALNQVLNAMVSMRGQLVSVPELKKLQRSPKSVIEFPVVICNSFEHIYSVDFYTESHPVLIKDNFQLEVRYAYFDRQNKHRDDYFLVDFVEYSQLGKFTEVIDKDAGAAVHLLSPS
jgi:hypothetical protein